MAMKQVEVNGLVMEFDEKLLLKQNIEVGDNVQLLIKEYMSSEPKLYPGVIIQILPYETGFPAVEVLYIDEGYNEIKVKRRVVVPGKNDEVVKIIKPADNTFLPFSKERAIDLLDLDIEKKEKELRNAKAAKDYFLTYYDKYFENAKEGNK